MKDDIICEVFLHNQMKFNICIVNLLKYEIKHQFWVPQQLIHPHKNYINILLMNSISVLRLFTLHSLPCCCHYNAIIVTHLNILYKLIFERFLSISPLTSFSMSLRGKYYWQKDSYVLNARKTIYCKFEPEWLQQYQPDTITVE